MTLIKYVVGDATKPIGNGQKIIAHCCNDAGGWGAGFVLALSKRWPHPERDYRAMKNRSLGEVRLIRVEPDIEVANIIGQVLGGDWPPVRYPALETAFETLAKCVPNLRPFSSFHMPRIGCGLAGGKWDVMEEIISETLCAKGIPVTVYDLCA